MAQYSAMGSLLRSIDAPLVIMNYTTPNKAYYNAAAYIDRRLTVRENDAYKVIPVLGTNAKR